MQRQAPQQSDFISIIDDDSPQKDQQMAESHLKQMHDQNANNQRGMGDPQDVMRRADHQMREEQKRMDTNSYNNFNMAQSNLQEQLPKTPDKESLNMPTTPSKPDPNFEDQDSQHSDEFIMNNAQQ